MGTNFCEEAKGDLFADFCIIDGEKKRIFWFSTFDTISELKTKPKRWPPLGKPFR